ncbi:radical SAM protein [Candidatus Desantisbacteria bacterium CG1_02_38_46]|uniref:Radical SAM protein n=3 Tax=unclassified Candidatus Desantisiibacteriota TaxID=3106372 RepID=A0A2H9PER4_9BACT|nr:MAG: radical SAM protein [Candidatus Desantisbacteria bacterium CG1_02_38_46]PIU52011.1 MAG: radical SAM protein [Candidatus Desantisbacteria bacterium CG07_land_8_20_14_0_80_39_15]PIZ17368.1 MAG: radical SAM protein [Candidatus Desantisbacteria bacterium CG_4_10_14_0_8_um_filter_39_17]
MTKLQEIDKIKLEERVKEAYSLLSPCHLCPRNCKVNRLKDKRGYCKAGLLPEIASFHPHYGEEPPISGCMGSGTIFFSHCSLRCVFCQNYSLSQMGEGSEVSIEELANIMLKLQKLGCHNINFVTPTHYTAQILTALVIAKEKDLKIPLVYNCGGYESVETLKILDGIIDIYMPDFKYGDNASAKKYSSAPDYVEVAKSAHKEMHRQVGDLVIENGVAVKGLLIRHLVMPDVRACSDRVFEFIAKELSPDTAVNIMAQYYPTHLAYKYPEIDRFPTINEYSQALQTAKDTGLNYGWRQTVSTLVREKKPEWKNGKAPDSDILTHGVGKV